MNGNANDQSGNGNNGTVNGALLDVGQNGQTNAAYDLGATNQTIAVGSPAALTNLVSSGFTYYCWLLRTGASVYHWPIIMGTSNTHIYYGIRSMNFGDSIAFEFGNSPYDGVSWTSTPGQALAVNSWHLVALTYSGTSMKLYWDGVLKDSRTATLNPTYGGMAFGTTTNSWTGRIDDARVYNRALTALELSSAYSAGAQ